MFHICTHVPHDTAGFFHLFIYFIWLRPPESIYTSNLSKFHETRDSVCIAVVVCRLSWSISIYFVAIHCWSVRCSRKLQKKITKTLYFGGSKSFKVISVEPLKNLSAVIVTVSNKSSLCLSACARRTNSGKITTFYGGTSVWCQRAEAFVNLGGQDLKC